MWLFVLLYFHLQKYLPFLKCPQPTRNNRKCKHIFIQEEICAKRFTSCRWGICRDVTPKGRYLFIKKTFHYQEMWENDKRVNKPCSLYTCKLGLSSCFFCIYFHNLKLVFGRGLEWSQWHFTWINKGFELNWILIYLFMLISGLCQQSFSCVYTFEWSLEVTCNRGHLKNKIWTYKKRIASIHFCEKAQRSVCDRVWGSSQKLFNDVCRRKIIAFMWLG